jgi:hypothetical protein
MVMTQKSVAEAKAKIKAKAKAKTKELDLYHRAEENRRVDWKTGPHAATISQVSAKKARNALTFTLPIANFSRKANARRGISAHTFIPLPMGYPIDKMQSCQPKWNHQTKLKAKLKQQFHQKQKYQ